MCGKNNLPFATLLADAAIQELSDLAPVLSFELDDFLNKDAVFFFGPWSLFHLRIEDFLPPVQALDVCAMFKTLCNSLPIPWLNQIKTISTSTCRPIKRRAHLYVLCKVSLDNSVSFAAELRPRADF